MNNISSYGINVSLVINGRPARLYAHEGAYWIESRVGSEYAIEIKNDNYYRVEVVASVDGLSVLTGKPAQTSERGYIVNGNDRIVIKGFRQDSDTVGAFKFTEKGSSYAAEKGFVDNTGIVAIRVFSENRGKMFDNGTNFGWPSNIFSTPFHPKTEPNWVTKPYYHSGDVPPATYCCNNTSVGTASVTFRSASFAHGTTWGQKVQDRVTTTSFDRGFEIFSSEIYYDSRENLLARGISLTQEKHLPIGFPGDYAVPPKGWQG